MASNRQIRTAVATALHNQLGSGWHVYPTPPDNINAPAVILGGINWQPHTQGGGRVVTIPAYVAVSRRHTDFLADLDDALDEDGPILTAFDADPTLDDVVDSAQVTSVGNYRDMAIADTDYYAATVNVEVYC